VAAGFAAPVAVAHALVFACQLRVACRGGIAYRKDRLAFELIGPVAACTAAFGHGVEMVDLLDVG